MKTSAKFIVLVFVAISSVAFATTPKAESVKVMESKQKYRFVFKADKSWKDAEVVVYSTTGDVVTSQKLSTKKMVVDFKDSKFGAYTIQVKKDGVVQEFSYEKKLVLSQVIR